jgi:hypothetical protein
VAKSPVFPQLDRLAEYGAKDQPHPRQPQQETPLDEIFTPDGVPTRKDDDDET